ncbi:Uncharacterized protein FKW44_017467 [Caligus rogercresseyi]|uniref:Uncharacterized protein n=1 Tax=Caligus rogercresseyi TaxID=217165 RepID=A0A7T8JVY7_CALRO|nr:Uncharacterized protein FKW44_017467 [Caligus rogercresseyi]
MESKEKKKFVVLNMKGLDKSGDNYVRGIVLFGLAKKTWAPVTQGKVDWIRHSQLKGVDCQLHHKHRVLRNEDLRKIIISPAARYSSLGLRIPSL